MERTQLKENLKRDFAIAMTVISGLFMSGKLQAQAFQNDSAPSNRLSVESVMLQSAEETNQLDSLYRVQTKVSMRDVAKKITQKNPLGSSVVKISDGRYLLTNKHGAIRFSVVGRGIEIGEMSESMSEYIKQVCPPRQTTDNMSEAMKAYYRNNPPAKSAVASYLIQDGLVQTYGTEAGAAAEIGVSVATHQEVANTLKAQGVNVNSQTKELKKAPTVNNQRTQNAVNMGR